MARVKAFLGYTWAALVIPVALVTILGMGPLMQGLVQATGLTISPWFSGGEVRERIPHGDYETLVHRPVFQALIGERREGFVQVAWAPPDRVPARLGEPVDYDGDGRADFRVTLDTANARATLSAVAPEVLRLEGPYRLDSAWLVRVWLRNVRR